MAELASVVDLANMPGIDLGQYTPYQVDMALRQATSRVIAEIGWDPRESERTYTIRNLCRYTPIFLPARHVTAVAVVADGDDLTVEDDWWTEDGRLDIPRGVTRGTVTYTAGWPTGDGETPSEIPRPIQDAALAIAVGLLLNTSGLKSWTVDDVSETYESARQDDTWPALLTRYSIWAVV